MTDGEKLTKGIFAPLSGLVIVFSSFKLFLYAVIPFWISFFIGVLGFKTLWGQGDILSGFIYSWVPGLKKIVEYSTLGGVSPLGAVGQLFFWLFSIIFMGYFSYLFLTIIGAPFYSLLSERILKVRGAKPFEASGFSHWFKTTVKMLVANCIKLVFFLILSGFLFVLSFFPIVLFMIPFLICLMISFDCMDFSFECMTFSLKERFHFFKKHLVAFFGFSLSVLVVGVIPGLFTFTLPFFIAGGAELFSQLYRESVR